MSELTNTYSKRTRWQLLTTASSLALLSTILGVSDVIAHGTEDDRPTVWIELGGQLERVSGEEQQFVPPFLIATPRPEPETISPTSIAHPPRSSFGGEGKISFEPDEMGWIFSAAVQIGRSNAHQHVHQQSYPTQPPAAPISSGQFVPFRKAAQFIDTQARSSEAHTILDFQVGKDVGLGLFGANSWTTLNAGVRFAQFGSRSNVAFKSDPDAHPTFKYLSGRKLFWGGIYHSNQATAIRTQSFHGIGPSLSVSTSTPLLGSGSEGTLGLDWGASASLLFGRQKAKVHHQTTSLYHQGKYNITNFRTTHYRHAPPDQARSRSVVVPNVGGFAGLSYRLPAAKVSVGYRADFFFGAMDGGINERASETRGFYGPFATVSIGLGN